MWSLISPDLALTPVYVAAGRGKEKRFSQRGPPSSWTGRRHLGQQDRPGRQRSARRHQRENNVRHPGIVFVCQLAGLVSEGA